MAINIHHCQCKQKLDTSKPVTIVGKIFPVEFICRDENLPSPNIFRVKVDLSDRSSDYITHEWKVICSDDFGLITNSSPYSDLFGQTLVNFEPDTYYHYTLGMRDATTLRTRQSRHKLLHYDLFSDYGGYGGVSYIVEVKVVRGKVEDTHLVYTQGQGFMKG